MAICVALLLALLAFVPTLVPAQGIETGVITGRVSIRADSGVLVPAERAMVTLVDGGLATFTGSDGRFVLARVPAGSSIVRVRLLGYRAVDRPVRIAAGDTIRLEIALEPEARVLEPVRSEAHATDAESFVSRPNIATVALDAAEMAGVPRVGEPDVARIVQLLPGVVARNDFNTGLNVRGGEADQNLILLDGHPIYNPFHLGGLFSTFMDATVGGIELLTGAFPARYGGRLSSVLDVRSAGVERREVHGSTDLSVLGASGRVAGTIGSDARGTWSVAGRRTFVDALTEIFTDDIFPYHFHDLHGRATYALPGGVDLALTGYFGRDVLDQNLAANETNDGQSRADEGEWEFDWGNQVLGLTVAKPTGDRGLLEQRLSVSSFSTRLDLGEGALVQRNAVRELRAAGSLLVQRVSHDWAIGYEVATHRVQYASEAPQTGTSAFDFVQRPVVGALWISDLWRLSPRWIVESGLRADALRSRNWLALSPRLSVKYFVTPQLAVTAGAGRVTQWMHSLAGDGPLRYFDIWLASDEHTPVATAWHGVAGVERRYGDAGSVRVEGYVKRYDRVMEANPSEDPQRRGDELFVADGSSYGVDLLARWSLPRGLDGWIAYSYGVSARTRNGVRWAPGHDRRHDLDVVATWQLAEYRIGARFGFASGTPYTPIVGQIARRVYDPSRDHWGTGDPQIYLEALGGVRHGARFPPSHRLDLDASRTFIVRGAIVVPYVSVANAYNAPNVFVYLYDYTTDRPTRRAISQFPILPSAGVRVGF